MQRRLVLLVNLAAPLALGAQTARAPDHAPHVERAVASITADDVRRRIFLLADDSMKGRDTPSPELEQAARYIAAEFHRFGLLPGGDSGTFIQRYAISRRQLDTAASVLEATGAHSAVLQLGRDVARLPMGGLPEHPVSGGVILVSGPPGDSAAPFGSATVKDAWIVMVAGVAPRGLAGLALDRSGLQAAIRAGARGVIVVSDRSDSTFARRAALVARPAVSLEGRVGTSATPFLEIRDAAARRALGIDPAALRGATVRTMRRLEGITLTLRSRQTVLDRITAPNVVGILEGSDPALKDEYVVFSAHMDHVGVAANGRCAARGADSICNGADDDASGTVAVVEAAEAFALLDPRPRRSVIFLTVSGEERGLWGSGYFADRPPVPIERIVANLNIDMVGRNWRDTIVAIGREHSDLGATLDAVAARHPELNMRPIDDIWPQENFYQRSDHYNFARQGVPILFFFNGTHRDYHQVSDHPDQIDVEKESRIVKLVFYLGLEIANAPQRPRWNPDSHRRIVQRPN